MSALPPRVMSGDVALLYVLEATVEILKAENESLKRQLAAAETRAAWAAIVERLGAPAADRDQLATERARPLVASLGGLRKQEGGGETLAMRPAPEGFTRQPCSLRQV